MNYDVIIAGASFAGLTVATRLKGKILLIDRKSIGSLPTSACATFYDVLKKVDCEDAVLKVLPTVNWQTSYNSYIYKTFQPFCTFDYEELCQILFRRFKGEFRKAHIKGYEDDSVITDEGTFSARAIIDCTGWRATLASSVERNFVDEKSLFFGLETVVPYEDSSLHFIMDRNIIERGYAWIFPIDKGSRVGLGDMAGRKRELVGKLKEFVASLDFEMGNSNGGFIPFKLRRGVVGKIFLVGDSAGQVFPLTVEGIRQCIYFGQECAGIVQRIIDGDSSLEDGLWKYQAFVERHRSLYNQFLRTQSLVLNMGPRTLDLISRFSCWHLPMQLVQRKYFRALRLKPH